MYISAGVMWCLIGLFLCRLALSWLIYVDLTSGLLFGGSGLLIAWLAYKNGLLKLAEKNKLRIDAYQEQAPFYAFMPLKSYLIIAIMVPLGYILRHSVIPKPILSVMYLGMGGSLFFASLHYFAWYRLMKNP